MIKMEICLCSICDKNKQCYYFSNGNTRTSYVVFENDKNNIEDAIDSKKNENFICPALKEYYKKLFGKI